MKLEVMRKDQTLKLVKDEIVKFRAEILSYIDYKIEKENAKNKNTKKNFNKIRK